MAVGILTQYENKINGTLSTFDRMLIKGQINSLLIKERRDYYLLKKNIMKKDFPQYAKKLSEELTAYAKEMAREKGRPYIHVDSSRKSKEEMARGIMKKDPITEGLICVIACVELCKTFTTRLKKETKRLEVVCEERKGLHVYFYFNDRQLGFMHARLQTWFPFNIQFYLNGREYVARQLDKNGIAYQRYDNCFLNIDDIGMAQEIADQLVKMNWISILNAIAYKVNPLLKKEVNEIFDEGYYLSVWQCEYATDVMFKSRKDLESLYPDFVEHAAFSFKSDDVMAFLGRKLNGNFKGEIVSDIKRRWQGIRIKHRMKTNSIKMYDKWSVLRVETTINNPGEFKIYRMVKRRNGKIEKAWVPMGKGISNLYRYAQVSKASNSRYLDALNLVKVSSEVRAKLESLCVPVQKKKRRYSSFNPISNTDCNVFMAVLNGGHMINGLSNKSLREKLFPKNQCVATDQIDRKKNAGRISRLLAKLRAHRLIAKIPHSFRYKITKSGMQLMMAILSIKRTEVPRFLLAS